MRPGEVDRALATAPSGNRTSFSSEVGLRAIAVQSTALLPRTRVFNPRSHSTVICAELPLPDGSGTDDIPRRGER